MKHLLIGMLLLAFLAGCSESPEPVSCQIPRIGDITIDGDFSDWQDKGLPVQLYADRLGKLVRSADFSAKFSLGWNPNGLLLAFSVVDDIPFENAKVSSLWAGDCIQIFLAPHRGATPIQFIISPGLAPDQPALRYEPIDRRQSLEAAGTALKIELARKKTETGYQLEALLPLSNLQLLPKPKLELGLQISVTDYDRARDPERTVLPWYYLTGTHENADAVERIQLTDLPQPPVDTQVRAMITDKKALTFVFWSDAGNVGKKACIFTGKDRLTGGYLYLKDGYGHNQYAVPLDSVTAKVFSAYVAGRHRGDFELDYLPFRYVELTPYPFEEVIQRFKVQDRKNPPPKNAFLFVGSSSIRMWKSLAEDMAPLPVINRGFGGSQAEHVLHYLDEIVLSYRPKAIVFYEGDNDLAAGVSPEAFLARCRVFAEKVHSSLPETRIYFLSIKPSGLRYHIWPKMQQANQLLQTFAKEHEYLDYIDIGTAMHDSSGRLRQDIFLPDDLHMNARGYAIWTKIVRERLEADF